MTDQVQMLLATLIEGSVSR